MRADTAWLFGQFGQMRCLSCQCRHTTVCCLLWPQVYAPLAKRRVLQLLDLPEQLLAVLSSDATSQVHVGCTSLAPDELQAYLAKQQQEQQGRQWKRIMGFRATGGLHGITAGP